MSELHEKICPICQGKGTVSLYRSKNTEYRKLMAKRLHKQNFTIREIQTIMGYKSPRSVQTLLEKK